MTAALLEVPGRAAEVLEDDAALHVGRAAGRAGAGRAVPRAGQLLSRSRWRER